MARRGRRGAAWRGAAGHGVARPGVARQAWHGKAAMHVHAGNATAIAAGNTITLTTGKTMAKKTDAVVISAPRFEEAAFLIRGTAPYVQNAFSQKQREVMRQKQE